jgi:hypothetical protein
MLFDPPILRLFPDSKETNELLSPANKLVELVNCRTVRLLPTAKLLDVLA